MAAVTIPRTAWIDDDGTGTTGTVLNNAVKTELYNQIDTALAQVDAASAIATAPPVWTPVAFNAANFTAGGSMTWTVSAGNQIRFSYLLNGKTMTVSWYIDSTTLGGTASTELRIAIPGGKTAAGWSSGTFWVTFSSAGTSLIGATRTSPGATYISLYRADLSNYALGSSNTIVTGTFTFEVN